MEMELGFGALTLDLKAINMQELERLRDAKMVIKWQPWLPLFLRPAHKEEGRGGGGGEFTWRVRERRVSEFFANCEMSKEPPNQNFNPNLNPFRLNLEPKLIKYGLTPTWARK